MLHIYATRTDAKKAASAIPQLLKELPASMHQRALRYKRESDAFDFICGRLLLREGLRDMGITETLEDIQIEENGKPSLESVFFNISHTSGLVVCALSTESRVGIDVEKEAKVDLVNFKAWFTPTEWQAIQEAPIPLHRFYQYWTRKESIIKSLGLKLSYLNQIQWDITQDMFELEGECWYLKELNLGAGYRGAICSEAEIGQPVHLKYISY